MINIAIDVGEIEEAMDIMYSTGAAISSKRFHNKVEERMTRRSRGNFGNEVDAYAAANPNSMHHVYEWGELGEEKGRLFNIIETGSGLTIEWRASQKPVPLPEGEPGQGYTLSRHIFVWKAPVQEYEKHSARITPGNPYARISQGSGGATPRFLTVWEDGRKKFRRATRAYYTETQGEFTKFWNMYWRASAQQETEQITKTGGQVLEKKVSKLLNTRARAAGMPVSPNAIPRGTNLFSKGRMVNKVRAKANAGTVSTIRRALLNRWKSVT